MTRRRMESGGLAACLVCAWAFTAARAADQALIRIALSADRPKESARRVRWIQAPRLSSRPRIDGRLDDGAWARASASAGFFDAKGRPAGAARVMAGRSEGLLCLGVSVDRAPAKGDAVEVYLDSLLDGKTRHVARAQPDGAFATWSWAGRRLPWKPRAWWGVARGAKVWAFELAISRRSLADPENDVIGFNVTLRGRDGCAWNPPGGEGADGMGRLAFETAPVTVGSIRVGTFVRGENSLRVTARNPTGGKTETRALVTTTDGGGGLWQRRYRFVTPANKTREVGLGFWLPDEGVCRLDLWLFDEKGRRRTVVRRRGITARKPLTLKRRAVEHGRALLVLEWPSTRRSVMS